MYYPNGDSSESSSNVSLFLNLVHANSHNFEACFKLGILAKVGHNNYMGFNLSMRGAEFETIPGFGQDKLIHYDQLFDCSHHLVNNCSITFICEVF